MPNYKVIRNLNHDGKDYLPDSTVELSAEAAKILLELPSPPIEASGNPVNDPPKAPEGEERVAAIKAAIVGLNVDLADNWLKGGQPRTEAIQAVTGWPVSAAERDTIWEELNKA